MKKILWLCLIGGFMCACHQINPTLKKTMLIQAIEKGNVKMLKMLIKAGADVNAETPFNHEGWGNKKTILFLAVEKNNVDIVRELIKAGVKNNDGVDDFLSPFTPANKNGNREMVQELLKITEIRPDWDFQLATAAGQLLTVQELLKRKDIDKLQVDLSLRQAVEHNHPELVRELIKAGGDVNYKSELPALPEEDKESSFSLINEYNASTLFLSVKNNNKEIFDELVKAGAQITPQVRGAQLYNAINRMDRNEVGKLLKQDTDVNLIWKESSFYYSSLSWAKHLKFDRDYTIKELAYLTNHPAEKEGEITVQDNEGTFHIFSKKEYAEKLEELQKAQEEEKALSAIIQLLESKGGKEKAWRVMLEM